MLERGPRTTISRNVKRHDSLVSFDSTQTSAAPAGSHKHTAYPAKDWPHQERLLNTSLRTARDIHSKRSTQGHSHHEMNSSPRRNHTSDAFHLHEVARTGHPIQHHSMSFHKFSIIRRVHRLLVIKLTVFELPRQAQHITDRKIVVSDSVRIHC